MKFPTLYKKTQTGATQQWCIETEDNVIITRYGQLDGAEQEARDTIKEGKSSGKKNATTAEQQTVLEAKAKWEKQTKKGYVEDVNRAEAGENDHKGGIDPMLAKKWSEDGKTVTKDGLKHIKFPAIVQAKYDGMRCIAVVENGKCTLWSRTRKPINSVPHIARAYEERLTSLGISDVVFDGELYRDDYKDEFEKIIELCRPDAPVPGHEIVQHHIYDIPSHEGSNAERDRIRAALIGTASDVLKNVESIIVTDTAEAFAAFRRYRDQGYEGAIIRNTFGKYKNARSFDLMKIVELVTMEFKIVGVYEGRGKLAGCAIFICSIHPDAEDLGVVTGDVNKVLRPGDFTVKMEGATDGLRKYLTDETTWRRKQLTVEFRNWTRKKVPRFPVAKGVRDYE